LKPTQAHQLGEPQPASDFGAGLIVLTLVAVPIALLMPVDWDRFLPLLFLPAFIAATRATGSTATPHTVLRWLWIAAVSVLVFSTCLSDHAARASATGAAWVLTIAGGFATRSFASTPTAIRRILAGLASGALLGFLIARSLVEPGGAIVPVYGHTRVLGMHMLTGSFAALALLVLDKPSTRLCTCIYYGVAGVVCGALWWAGGRAPLLGILSGLSLWLWRSPIEERRRLLRCLPVVGLLAAVVAFSAGSPSLDTGWLSPFSRSLKATNLSELSSTRTEIWEVASRITDSLWIGHGADSYLFIRPRQIGDQPHNVLIQWMLDFGLFGTLPLVLLLGWSITRGLRNTSPSTNWSRVASACLSACAVAGLFDGMFYHTVLLMPVAVFGGLVHAIPSGARSLHLEARTGLKYISTSLVGICVVLLAFHHWLAFSLAYSLPESPQAPAARLLRIFPSTTFPLTRWLAHWENTAPEAAIEWAQWAEPHAISPVFLHVFSARYYAHRNLPELAAAELHAALEKCRVSERDWIKQELDHLHRSQPPYEPRPASVPH
jgi:O-antigen ligase